MAAAPLHSPDSVRELASLQQQLGQCQQDLARAREAACRAEQTRSEFLANISHELRTPLNSTIGLLRLVLDGMTDSREERQEFVEQAYLSALQLLDSITVLLDLGQLQARTLALRADAVNLRELLAEAEAILRPQAFAQHLDLVFEPLPTQDELIVCGDAQRLLQVLLNLVGNGLKFTPAGRVCVRVQVSRACDWVQVQISDTGIGVPLDRLPDLFQPFYQVDGARTRQYGGLGLGLAISRQLMEAMGGSVDFYSLGAGLGATVTVQIPLYQRPVLA